MPNYYGQIISRPVSRYEYLNRWRTLNQYQNPFGPGRARIACHYRCNGGCGRSCC